MANQNTVAGIYNYPVTLSQYAAGTELALLAPLATGVYPSLPSPSIPLSTSTYPVVLWQGVSPDIAGGEFDGHPFQVSISGTITGPSGTSTATIKLYQASNAVLTSGFTSSTYAQLLTAPPSGTGISGTSSAGAITVTSSVKTNFSFQANYMWDSVSQTLCAFGVPVAYAIGATLTGAITTAKTTSVGVSDLNFFPTLTFATTVPASVVVKEFVINRL